VIRNGGRHLRCGRRLRKLQPEAVVNAVNVAEVLAKLVGRGMPGREAQAAFDALHLETMPFESAMAADSVQSIHKSVSLGDRCFLVAASVHGAGWASDHGLSALADRVTFLNFFR
jgi:PIN domain nuclease of toxin-antitoxin system